MQLRERKADVIPISLEVVEVLVMVEGSVVLIVAAVVSAASVVVVLVVAVLVGGGDSNLVI
jgi:hypothetical protein